jgi:hypothetical protein
MKTIVELTREAGFAVGLGSPALEKFERLIAMARADEREACAKVCDDLDWSQDSTWQVATIDCAEAIRARGETK